MFGAVAPALLQSGVGSVIAFSHSVHIAAASLLCERLYRELAAGASIGEALEEARAALLANRARWLTPGPDPETVDLQDWIIPQLYQGGGDPVLIPAGSTIQSDRHDDPVDEVRLPGFPPAPRYRFHGRARELLTLERALQRHPAVLLHAGGGMGKTALAREAAHWWRRTGRFDHALFHSFEQGAGAEAVVRLIGETQEGEQGGDGFVALGPDAQWTEAVRLFRRTQLLLVWDNFESVGAAFGAPMGAPIGAPIGAPASGRPVDETSALLVDLQHLYRDLTEGTPTGRLLVTCRPAETGLDGIAEVPLAGLARPDALHLLRSAVERKAIDLERPGYERSAIDALLDRLADHPLSIELIAPHLKALTPKTIGAELAERLDQFEDRSHAEGRNRSLLASLDFSHRRLSPAARAALPWLGWFEGGMFERFFLDFAEIPEQEWAGIRAELTTTALLRVEDLPDFNPPYLKLHPTLAEAAAPDGTDSERARRFIDVYLAVGQQIAGALRGAEPAAGMALMRREQANLRQAMALAFDAARHRVGAMLAETLRNYLERAGRLRERDRLTALVRVRMPEDRLDGAGCAAIRQYAWSLLTQGLAQQALDAVQDLERRLDAGELRDGDPATQLALTRTYRGRILDHAGRPDLGIEPLEQAVAGLRGLGDDRRGNLSIALGDLTNALRHLGRYDRALAVADEALEIDRALGRDREVAAGLGRTAEILMDAGRHAEAEARYGEALETAERVGDLGLQGLFLQHLGSLQRKTDRTAESVDTLRRAFRLFQQSGDRGSEMRTSDLLGSAEMLLGRPDPAEAWYRKALDLASDLGDQHQIGITRQNLGILRQTRAEAAVDAAECDRLLAAAVTEIEASLDVWQEMHNQLNTAASHGQLSILHRLRGDPDRAETEARQALAIYEPLNNPNTWKVYANLADIARARGDETAAADWQAKADVKRAELDRLAAGPETGGDPGAAAPDRQLIEMLIALTQAVHDARGHHRAPEPDVAEALAQLAGLPAPYGPFGCFLEAIARGEDATAPPDLPEPLDKIAGDLLDALRT